MPAPVRGPVSPAARTPAARTYKVRPGDTLYGIAQKALGDGTRWKEIHQLNRGLIGGNLSGLQPGMVLKLPVGATPAPTPTPTPKPNPQGDADRDGVIDRFDFSPQSRADRRWNDEAAKAYATFVAERTTQLRQEGTEIDCADFTVKLLADFCKATGLPNPLAGKGSWHTYSPAAPGGLPNVKGPTYFFKGIHADNLAKAHTKDVKDLDGDGITGWDRATGQVDVDDLRPGDILFYDWDHDGAVNHTVNVVGVDPDGTVTLAYGTYDNMGDGPLTWGNLDILPIQHLVLRPGTAAYEKWLGKDNALWGARRFGWMEGSAPAPEKPTAPPPDVKRPAAGGLRDFLDRVFGGDRRAEDRQNVERWREVQLIKSDNPVG